jgi:predicted RNA-binding protein with PUA-like domain
MNKVVKKMWLVKQEPSKYSWDDFVKEGGTPWTGVRNFQARNNLADMAVGDSVLFYHSVVGKCIVGLACVRKSAYPDPTAKEGNWVCVDLQPVRKFPQSVSLETIKMQRTLRELPLLKQSRLSVMPISQSQFFEILKLAGE